MKIEQTYGRKIMGKVAAVIALGAGASAQFARGADSSQTIEGRPVAVGSLENDMHYPELELSFEMKLRRAVDPFAITPLFEDMGMTLVLSNGTSGGLAAIDLDTKAGAGAVRISGFFDEDGLFSVELPDDLDVDGLFVRGAAGRARRAQGPVTDWMSLEEAAEEAYAHWVTIWTRLQFRSTTRARSGASAEPETSVVAIANRSAIASASDGQQGGDTFGLQRPRTPARGVGHTQPSRGVDNDIESGVGSGDGSGISVEDFSDIDMSGIKRAGKKIPLHRPLVPAQVDGHILRKTL